MGEHIIASVPYCGATYVDPSELFQKNLPQNTLLEIIPPGSSCLGGEPVYKWHWPKT